MTTHSSKTYSVNYALLSHITIYQMIPVKSGFPSYCCCQKPCDVIRCFHLNIFNNYSYNLWKHPRLKEWI